MLINCYNVYRSMCTGTVFFALFSSYVLYCIYMQSLTKMYSTVFSCQIMYIQCKVYLTKRFLSFSFQNMHD